MNLQNYALYVFDKNQPKWYIFGRNLLNKTQLNITTIKCVNPNIIIVILKIKIDDKMVYKHNILTIQ